MSSLLHLLILQLTILIPLLFCYGSFAVAASPLSTIAVTEVGNQTLVCAIFPSVDDCPYALKCTAFPSGKSRTYGSHSGVLYSAVAAGNGFLCALGSVPENFSVSSMRWWDIGHGPNVSKRVYEGPPLSALVAGDSHVCGLIGDTGKPYCWRWPEISIPSGLRLSAISVGKDFVCGLSESGEALCFGGNASGIIGNEPKGEFSVIAAGTRHACVVGVSGKMVCWGAGAPTGAAWGISSLALGNGRTCAIRINGTVSCFGADAELPRGFETDQFMAVEARGSAFCGVLTENYSVICWGSDAFRRNPVVYNQVLPGSCSSISRCPCGVVPGSGNSCGHGAGICQSCPKRIPSPTPPPPSPPPRALRPTAAPISPAIPSRRRRLIFIILGALGFGIGCLASASFLITRARNRGGRVHDSDRGPPAANAGDPSVDDRVFSLYSKGPGQTVVEYPIETLLAATENFAEKHKIGSGGFGSVYRAVLPDGRVVAIKRGKAPPPAAIMAATPSASNSPNVPRCRKEMESAFLAELALLSRVNHKNLVRLYGFCQEDAELILVYEFMTRGTLDAHLRNPGTTGSPLRSWAGRIRVALDAARGIEYLHVYAVPTIIHRDIKSSNILLDDEWSAKVSDFGLSLLNPKEGEQCEGDEAAAAGTVGYMDPEYYRLRHLTAKSDVYSFGVMLLELLTGSKAVERSAESGTPRNLVEYAVPRIEMDEVHCVLDVRLPPPTPCEIEAVAYVGYLAADCVSPAGRDRPTMSEVVAGLERALFAAAQAGGSPSSTGPGCERVHAAD